MNQLREFQKQCATCEQQPVLLKNGCQEYIDANGRNHKNEVQA